MNDNKGNIVVVDDDHDMRELLRKYLQSEGYRVTTFPSATEALPYLQNAKSGVDGTDLVFTDLKMSQMDGMQFLRAIKEKRTDLPVILMTAFASVDTAIEAIKNGAYHYVVKPLKLPEVKLVVERAIEHRNLKQDNKILRQEVKQNWRVENIIGKGAAMRGIFDLVQRVAQSTASILINGESGTGKEVIARAIHNASPRAGKPFVAINCTAIPEALLESELFGHAKGSFTGAIQRKRGLFEEADGGTLFLDEIGDMNPQLQAKLLRVLQERKIRPVGDNNLVDVDVHVIAATHKDLKLAIKEGRFREDLFYRLSVIPIVIPALRERTEDIPLLAEYFLAKYSAANGQKAKIFSAEAMMKLVGQRWPGNVRELENVIERAVVLTPGMVIEGKDIPGGEAMAPATFFQENTSDFPTIDELEKRYIKLVMDKVDGHKEKAANILGINRRTLYRKEREYGWVVEEETAGEQKPQSNA